MKIVSYYLPQFYETEENNLLWGKGFTEWDLLRKAKPLFHNHRQPRVPKWEYDLSDVKALQWQASLAKHYGIYGFCIYHYWFSGQKLLNIPLETLLHHPEIDIPFCLCWANQDWTDSWYSAEPHILIKQRYNDENDWKNHFKYLLPFLQDSRYIRIHDKPLIVLYKPHKIPNLAQHLKEWQDMSIRAGLGSLAFASQHPDFFTSGVPLEYMDYTIEYHPCDVNQTFDSNFRKQSRAMLEYLDKKSFFERFGVTRPVRTRKYDMVWNNVLNLAPQGPHSLPGAFVGWDNTPRYGRRGSCIIGQTPEKFHYYLTEQMIRAKNIYNSDFLFLFAWNEWSEGGYLEPDTENGTAYLSAVRSALERFYKVT